MGTVRAANRRGQRGLPPAARGLPRGQRGLSPAVRGPASPAALIDVLYLDTAKTPLSSPGGPDAVLFQGATVTAPVIVHTTLPGRQVSRCGRDGPVVPWEQVLDPADPTTFGCGYCWTDAAGGVEPMGGSQYLATAQGAGTMGEE